MWDAAGWEQWKADRLAALTAADGWLNLTDRLPMEPGRWTVGRAAENDLVLSVGPDHLGVLELRADLGASLSDSTGVQDFAPEPDTPARLRVAGLLLEIHIVEGAAALRVRLIDHPARRGFPGLTLYPFDPAWVIRADWVALETPVSRAVEMVRGATDTVTQTHVARFSHAGHDLALVPTHVKGGKPMFVIRDLTSGSETYGASRFLIGVVEGDQVVLDFNRAHNPPCAFTEHAICPLPPPENRLPFALRVGELKPAAH